MAAADEFPTHPSSRVALLARLAVAVAVLHDEAAAPVVHDLLEHLLEVLLHVGERAGDGLVLALVQHVHQLLDRRLAGAQLVAARQ
jgi:hypothetical protein